MRARLQIRVLYDAPAFGCRRVVRILPRLGRSMSEQLVISPLPTFQQEQSDRFGNRVLHIHHSCIEQQFLFQFECYSSLPDPSLQNEAVTSGIWKMPSRAVLFSHELGGIARSFRSYPPPQRARALNTFVFESLTYQAHSNDKPPAASHVWEQRRGSCADFAHVLLALSRASGLPARYVAGFGPAPGALHAWVELGFNGAWHAFDPTHGRETKELYLPVAIGRDYYDCSPHRGVFHGGNARLELECELQSGT